MLLKALSHMSRFREHEVDATGASLRVSCFLFDAVGLSLRRFLFFIEQPAEAMGASLYVPRFLF